MANSLAFTRPHISLPNCTTTRVKTTTATRKQYKKCTCITLPSYVQFDSIPTTPIIHKEKVSYKYKHFSWDITLTLKSTVYTHTMLVRFGGKGSTSWQLQHLT